MTNNSRTIGWPGLANLSTSISLTFSGSILELATDKLKRLRKILGRNIYKNSQPITTTLPPTTIEQWPIINYKWHAFPEDVAVLDLERSKLEKTRELFWQTDTSVATNSWGYTANQNYKPVNRIVDDFIDIVSKNGCLLLNIGPKADGTIPEQEQEMLREIGGWLKVNGEAVYGSRPFQIFGEGPTGTATGHLSEKKNKPYVSEDYRFTTQGDTIYAFVLDKPKDGKAKIKTMGKESGTLKRDIKSVSMLGHDGELSWNQTGEFLEVNLPEKDPCKFALVLKIN